MILDLINGYFQTKVSELNSRYDLGIKLFQIQTDMDLTKIPNSEKSINYQLFISGVATDNIQSAVLSTVSVRIDFFFLVVNKNYKTYQNIFSQYLWNLFRIIKSDESQIISDTDISYSLRINDIQNVKINNSDNFEDNKFKPNITFDLLITDSENNNTGVQP